MPIVSRITGLFYTLMKILVIEDERSMRENMVDSLLKENFIVETASSYDEALEKTGVYEYDCILLDIGLPGGSGLKILEELRKEKKAEGVIIVSARNSLDDRIAGLDLGADDYLPKPFHLAELNARVKSVIRRRRFNGNPTIECSELVIDYENRNVIVRGEELPLNRKEFDILLYLVINKERLVNKNALAEHVWGDYIDETNSFDFIYSQIKNLRRKLKEYKVSLQIQSIYGIGYKLTTE
jgi:two-component system, OmpR family, response regulator ArlR